MGINQESKPSYATGGRLKVPIGDQHKIPEIQSTAV